jgi:hypothetical protein
MFQSQVVFEKEVFFEKHSVRTLLLCFSPPSAMIKEENNSQEETANETGFVERQRSARGAE